MRGLFFICCLLTLPAAYGASSGCDEGKGQCYYYKAGEKSAQSACKVTVCAAKNQPMFSLWNWENGDFIKVTVSKEKFKLLINDRPAYSFPLKIRQDRMSCYGISGTDELICNDTGIF